MADQVSQTLTRVGWGLLIVIGVAVLAGALYGLAIFLITPVAVWLKLLVLVALIGGALLCFVVVRDRVRDQKSDKYKDVEI